MDVTGDAKTISWLREDDHSLIGINVASAQNMQILMKDNGIDLVKYFKSIEETLYPEKDIKEKDRYLEGFKWRIEERPKCFEDIFLKAIPRHEQSASLHKGTR